MVPARPAILFALVVATTALAGCIGSGDDVELASTEPLATPSADLADLIAGLPCAAAVDEVAVSETSANLRDVTVLDSTNIDGGSTHGELWRTGDRMLHARYGTGGIDIYDIRDPRVPALIGTWDPETVDRGLDVKSTTDGTGALAAGDRGVTLVDIRNPAAPVLEAQFALDQPQAHMLTVGYIGDHDYVFVAAYENVDLITLKIVGEAGARTFEEVGRSDLRIVQGFENVPSMTTHDFFFTHDALLDLPVLWVANGNEGIKALDVSDPAAPTDLLDHTPIDAFVGYHHTVQTVVVGDRRITVSIQEVGNNALKVFDTTDLSAPRMIAFWNFPASALPQHNIQVVDERVYVAHYDQGVFVFDISGLTTGLVPTRLSPVAHLAALEGGPSAGPGGLFRGVWDVVLKDGVLYTGEIGRGLRTAAFGCLVPGDAEQTSTG